MNYGLYLAAAGTLTNLHRQDVLANNLANVNTVGFKPDDVAFRARLPERLESNAAKGLIEPQLLLEQLGGGTYADPTRTDFHQGELNQTKNDFDLAIDGDGFFVVSDGRSPSADSIRLTRDGRLTRNAAGELVMAANGMRVLDNNNSPIRLNAGGQVRIDREGNITQNGQSIAKLNITSVADKSRLTKQGDNLLRPPRNARLQTATGTIRQGWVESSGVDPILAMNEMINASKAVQANATMMQYHDNILGQAINTLGRVA